MKNRVLLCLLAVGFAGCASKKMAPPYAASSEYQNRALLEQSLFRSDQALLSNEEIRTILSSRIELPRQAHLSILRLGQSDEALAWVFLSGQANPFSGLVQHSRLARVSWLPSLLVPEKLNVPGLREDTARFQAYLKLVYRTPCQQYTNYRLFGADRSKTYCVAEGLLLDVRTGVIPFSGAAVHEVAATESKADVDFYETMRKAQAEASAAATAELAQQLAEFLSTAP
jgi:hypothetical protein